MRSSIRLRVVDVAAIMTVTGVVASLVGAAATSKMEIASRMQCANNLRQLGAAIRLYANENRGAYPRTPYAVNAPPTWGTPYGPDNKDAEPTQECDPFATEGDRNNKPSAAALATRPKPNDVTAAMFLLLRTQDIVVDVFTCPGTTLKRWDYELEVAVPPNQPIHGVLDFTNFYGTKCLAEHVSYSYQNPYASPDAIMAGFKLNNSIPAEFVVMADMNPGNKALLEAHADTAPKPGAELTTEQRALNSLNHLGDGQNVLFGDGHVDFVNTPFAGQKHDNIFVAGDLGEARKAGKPAFNASPVDSIDNILLPTASDIGQKPESSDMPPPADAEIATQQKKFAGTYEFKRRDQSMMTLVIDNEALALSDGTHSVKFKYQIVGRRLEKIVIEVTDLKGQTFPSEIWIAEDGLRFDLASGLPGPWKKRPAK